MRIRVERSGGFTGITVSNEIDSKDLPSALIDTAKKIIEDKKVSSASIKSTPKGSADHFNYRISIQDGVNQKIVECNEYTIQDELRSLVKYIDSNSKKTR